MNETNEHNPDGAASEQALTERKSMSLPKAYREAVGIIRRLIAPRVGCDKKSQLNAARTRARSFLKDVVCPDCNDIPGNGREAWGHCATCRGIRYGADQSARIAELERRVEEAERERAKLNIAMSALESISVFEENMHGEGPAIEALAKIYKL